MYVNVGNSYRIDIVLKEPVRVNGLKLFRPMKEFEKPVLISLGEHPFQQSIQVEASRPKKKKEEVAKVECTFDTKMVRWVRLEPQGWDVHDWITYSIELYSPDKMYANGVFATLGRMNQEMRNVCKFFVQDFARSHEEVPKKRFTFQEKAPWIEAEIVHGRLKLTGYSISWGNSNFPAWTLRGSDDRSVPIEKWEILHRYVISSPPVSLMDRHRVMFECPVSEPMKYFRLVADEQRGGQGGSMTFNFDVHGTLCPE